MKFGYYPSPLDIATGPISVHTLPEFKTAANDIAESGLIHKEWIYARQSETTHFGTETVSMQPYSSRVFGLPKTHDIRHSACNGDDHLDFLVWCLGFFCGMRLTTTVAGFLDATPIKSGKLCDFQLVNSTLADALELSDKFWADNRSNPKHAKLVVGILNSLHLSVYPQRLDFERFIYAYTALDACYRLAACLNGVRKKDDPPHEKRIAWLCGHYGIPVPSWALPDKKSRSAVSIVRNDTMHEALFFEEALGYAIYGGTNVKARSQNVPLQMQGLVRRLLVAFLGAPHSDYVTSEVNTRQRIPLELRSPT